MKKLLLILFSILTLISIVNAGNIYNESFEDFYVDPDEWWCMDKAITFTVHNNTDYYNKKDIEKDLCKEETDTFEENECFDGYKSLEGSTVEIYNGPIDSLGIQYETTVDSNNQFNYTFNEENGFIIRINNDDNFNTFETIFDVRDCNLEESDKEIEKRKEIVLENKSFSYSEAKSTLNIKNTNITNKSLIEVEEIPLENLEINTLEFTKKIISHTEIGDNIYDEIEYSFYYLPKLKSEEIKLYRNDKKGWTQLEDFKNENNRIVFTDTLFGTYAIVDKGEEIESIVINSSESSENKEEVNVNDDTNSDNLNSGTNDNSEVNLNSNSETYIDESGNIIPLIDTKEKLSLKIIILVSIAIIVGIILVLYLLTKMFGNMNNDQFDYSSYGIEDKKTKIDTTKDIASNHENHNIEDSTKLSTYQTTYDKSKDYVRKYKATYNKDLIYHSLERANIPKDIIDKVFVEEF